MQNQQNITKRTYPASLFTASIDNSIDRHRDYVNQVEIENTKSTYVVLYQLLLLICFFYLGSHRLFLLKQQLLYSPISRG
jgi:hypothetical protein